MKARIGTLFIAGVVASALWLSPRASESPPFFATWSDAPLVVSLVSFGFLLVRAALAGQGALQSASTASYLISGPSSGTSFLLQYLVPSMTAPPWVMWTQAVLFFGSAGLYYLGHGYSEDERPSKSVVRPFSNV